MAQITKEQWDRYIVMLRAVNQEAAFEIAKYLNMKLLGGGYDIGALTDEQRKELIDYAYAIVNKYGEASAALSAEMYDAVAILEGRYTAPAEIAQIASYGDVAKTVNGVLKTSENTEELASAVSRWVKMAGADTTLQNAMRDGAQFAWIPYGETCAFCITLASRGWQYASRNTLKNGHAEHIHSNCDCQYAIRYSPQTTIEGYDPDAYLSMYQNAEGRTPRDKINYMRREAYADDKETEGTDNQGLIDVNDL